MNRTNQEIVVTLNEKFKILTPSVPPSSIRQNPVNSPLAMGKFGNWACTSWKMGQKNIFYVNIILCSATDIYTNVHVELSTVIGRQKELRKKLRCRLGKGQVAELWNDLSVYNFCYDLSHMSEPELTLDISIETWQEQSIKMINCLEVTPHYNLNIEMAKMLTDQTLMDATLNVKDKEFKAHKVVLAAASPVFKSMFKEGTKEHEDNYVNIEDIDSDVFDVFLRYLYSGQVDKLDEMCLDLLVAADKYVDNAVDVLALAHRFSIDSIKSKASNYLKDNFSAVTQTDSWTSLFDNFVAKK